MGHAGTDIPANQRPPSHEQVPLDSLPSTWLKETGLVLLVAAGLCILMTWPLCARLFSSLPGPAGKTDTPLFAWDLWWFQTQWAEWFPSPLQCNYQFYPLGVDLSHNTNVLLYGLMGAPLTGLLGLTAGFNLILLSTFLTSAVAAYWIARTIGLGVLSAHAGAILFAFSSYRLHRLQQHANMLKGDWIAFYALLLMLLLMYRRWGRLGVLLGLSMTLCFYVGPEGALYLAILSAVYIACFLRPWRSRSKEESKRIVLALVLAAVVAIVFVSPYILAYQTQVDSGNYHLGGGHVRYAADLAGFIRPGDTSTFWRAVAGRSLQFRYLQEGVTFFGFTALAFFLTGFLWPTPNRALRFWKVAFVVFLVVSLGPQLKIAANTTYFASAAKPDGYTIWLPGALLQYVPILENFRAPERFHEVTSLAFAIIAAYGLSRLIALKPVKPYGWALSMVLMIAALLESASLPFTTFEPERDVFEVIRQDPDDVTVLDSQVNLTSAVMNQVWHGKPMIAGYTARTPPEIYAYVASAPFLGAFAKQGGTPEEALAFLNTPNARGLSEQVVDLLNIRYAVLNGPNDAYKKNLLDSLLPNQQVASSNGIEVYRLDRPGFSGLRPKRIVVGEGAWSAYLAHGWGQFSRWPERHAGRWAIWPCSPTASVLFRMDEPEALRIAFDVYLPASSHGVQMTIAMNGTSVGTVQVPTGTNTVNLTVPKEWVKAGLNEMEFAWPYSDNTYKWNEAGSVTTDLVLLAGTVRGPSTVGGLKITGQHAHPIKPGYNIVELSEDGRKVRRGHNSDPYTDKYAWESFVRYIDEIPEGTPVAFLTSHESSREMTSEAVAALRSLGSDFDMRGRLAWSHAGVGKKGMAPGEALEAYSGESSIFLSPGRCAFFEFRFETSQ